MVRKLREDSTIIGDYMSENELVKVRIEDGIGIVTVDNPPVNALNSSVLEKLDKVIDDVSDNKEIVGIVLTGGGNNAFCAGADIKSFAQLTDPDDVLAVIELGQKVFKKLSGVGKPVVAAINGAAYGGGNELALSCDIRISSDRARFSQPEVNLGLIPAWGGTQRLSRLVGVSKAKELIFTGQFVTAQEAYRIGMVNKVVPDGEELRAASDIVRQIASRAAPLAIKAAKEIINAGNDESTLEEGLGLEVEAMKELVKTEDIQEGIKGFTEKRQPKFQGK